MNNQEIVTNVEPSISSNLEKCPGLKLPALAPFFLNYPFALHQYLDLSWTVEPECDVIRSKECQSVADVDDACDECEKMIWNTNLKNILARARDGAEPGCNYKYLSHQQLSEMLISIRSTIKMSQLAALNASKKIERLTRVNDWNTRLLKALSQNHIPRVHQLISVALKDGKSARGVLSMVEKAISNLYHAKGFDEEDADIAFLVLSIGGPLLLHALSRREGFATERWVQKYCNIPKFLPCMGDLESFQKTLVANLTEQLLSRENHRGLFNALIDEIHCEEKIVYNSVDNRMHGFCREHINGLDIRVINENSIIRARCALRDGRVHLAKECTAWGISLHDEKKYSFIPLLVLPSCKTETLESGTQLLRMLIYTTSTFIKRHGRGELGAIATDGDPRRRKALLDILTSHKLLTDYGRFEEFEDMRLFDISVGKDNISMTFDPKHIFKRISTRIRSQVVGTGTKIGAITNQTFKRFLKLSGNKRK